MRSRYCNLWGWLKRAQVGNTTRTCSCRSWIARMRVLRRFLDFRTYNSSVGLPKEKMQVPPGPVSGRKIGIKSVCYKVDYWRGVRERGVSHAAKVRGGTAGTSCYMQASSVITHVRHPRNLSSTGPAGRCHALRLLPLIIVRSFVLHIYTTVGALK